MRIRALSIIAVVALAILAPPVAAQVDDSLAADPVETTSTTTVPVFGTSLVIAVVSDAAGNFVQADIEPADPTDTSAADLAAGFEQSVETDGTEFEIRFDNPAAGVEIEVEGSAGTIDEVEVEGRDPGVGSGAGQWVGDPLGNGSIATVPYTVGQDAQGNPTLTIGTPAIDGPNLFAFIEDQIAKSEGDELKIRQVVILHDGVIRAELEFEVELEHGKVEIEVKLRRPDDDDDDRDEGRRGDDDDRDDDRGDDDDHDDDHDDDRGDDDRGDDDDDHDDDRGDRDDDHDED